MARRQKITRENATQRWLLATQKQQTLMFGSWKKLFDLSFQMFSMPKKPVKK